MNSVTFGPAEILGVLSLIICLAVGICLIRHLLSETIPDGLFKNNEGEYSGAKIVLMSACGLCVAWLGRDLILNNELTEWHTVLLGVLLIIGLVNRLSARGAFRLHIKNVGEIEVRDTNEC